MKWRGVCPMCGLNSDQSFAPVYDMVRCYVRENTVRFHMPGHKGVACSDEAARLAQDMWQMDVTELDDTDNLHIPNGGIAQAQAMLANAYGADCSFFMVNGSTGGVYAMMLSASRPGDTIIVGRNCHKSVINGLILADLNPIYIWPETLNDWHIAGQITPEQVDAVLNQYPRACAVIITSPDYYGLCADVAGIAKVCHNHGVPLLVDEAHGAHFAFHENLPPTAGQCGADIWVNSMHKTLPALTQTAVLHMSGRLLDVERVKVALQIVQTTSPSYILMASIDIARCYMENEGHKALDTLLDLIEELSRWSTGIDDIRMMTGSVAGRCGVAFKDPTRLCFDISGLGITGAQADRLLGDNGVQIEMADPFNVVLIATVMDDAKSFAALKKAIADLAASRCGAEAAFHIPAVRLPQPVQAIMPRQASIGPAERIPLAYAEGRIAAQPVGLYPPGIPMICPGESIDANIIDILLAISEQGGRIFNIDADKTIAVIRG